MSPARYLEADATLTLREAIEELRSLEEDVSSEVVSPVLQQALDAHDAVHVVFGCDITEADEVLAHIWMVFGTSARMADLRPVISDPDHQRFAASSGVGHRALMLVRSLPAAWRTLRAARRMTVSWPFLEFDQHLDDRLTDLRLRYNIVVPERRSMRDDRGPHHPPTHALA